MPSTPSTALQLCRAVAVATLLLHGVARAANTDEDPDFRPGRGLQVAGTGFNFGGYATIEFGKGDDLTESLSLKHASLFMHWDGQGRLRFFSELDLETPIAFVKGAEPTFSHAYPSLERLYADYLYSDWLNFRLGKFLTPIGRWNVIHADPLVWTTSRPLVTDHAFPTNSTALMAFGSTTLLGRPIDYSIYTALPQDWLPNPHEVPFQQANGIHVTTPLAGAGEIGVSAVSFVQRGSSSDRKRLFGIDYLWSHDRFEVTAEAIYRLSAEGGVADERGAFVQAVAPLSERLYLVGRYEFYEEQHPTLPNNTVLAGLAFKYSPSIIFKAEFTHSSNEQMQVPQGFFTSMSLLF